MTEPALCVAAACWSLDQHWPGCTYEKCRGCLPRLANEPPRLICRGCHLNFRDELRSLPKLYNDLLTPTTHAAGGTTRGYLWDAGLPDPDRPTGDPATLPEHLRARDDIRAVLVAWCKLLADEYAAPLPADTVPAMAGLIAGYADQILQRPDLAAELVNEIHNLHVAADRRANPASPPGEKLCDCPTCGAPVRARTTYDRAVRCPGCGVVRSVDDWHAAVLGDLTETTTDGEKLAGWLTYVHRRQVTPNTIARWASHGVAIDGERVHLPRQQREPGTRAQYDVATACRIAAHLYGRPATRIDTTRKESA